jgi:outer membrane receptor for ferrienterochelin and colicins
LFNMKKGTLVFSLILLFFAGAAQQLSGIVMDASTREPLQGATVKFSDTLSVVTDGKGKFTIAVTDQDSIRITAVGYTSQLVAVSGKTYLQVFLLPDHREMDAIVVTGTMKPVKRLESPVAVEVYTPQFFKKNPAPSIFESLQNVNGVRPQLNCSVCNTGDIHINGLEGPYTMVTIDRE